MENIRDTLKKTKALVLDFDGTLVDSNPIKWGAFEKCFVDYPDNFEAILAYCKANQHTHRHAKFRHVFEKILKKPYTPEIEKWMLEKYDAETTEQVIRTPEIPGALAFLKKFSTFQKMALLSSTPHETLLYILEKRHLKNYFYKIQGAPVQKDVWLQNFCAENCFKTNDILFIGDSEEDAVSSEKAGVPFVCLGKTKLPKATYHIVNFEELS